MVFKMFQGQVISFGNLAGAAALHCVVHYAFHAGVFFVFVFLTLALVCCFHVAETVWGIKFRLWGRERPLSFCDGEKGYVIERSIG